MRRVHGGACVMRLRIRVVLKAASEGGMTAWRVMPWVPSKIAGYVGLGEQYAVVTAITPMAYACMR
jgi:hypothetical protein